MTCSRNPYDWATAMHTKCYCRTRGPETDEDIAKLDFKTFIQMAWLNDTYFNQSIRFASELPQTGTATDPFCPNIMQACVKRHDNLPFPILILCALFSPVSCFKVPEFPQHFNLDAKF